MYAVSLHTERTLNDLGKNTEVSTEEYTWFLKTEALGSVNGESQQVLIQKCVF